MDVRYLASKPFNNKACYIDFIDWHTWRNMTKIVKVNPEKNTKYQSASGI